MIDMKAADLAALQAELILDSTPPPAQPARPITQQTTTTTPSKPRRKTHSSLYDLIGQSVATIFGLAVNAALWWFGAAFTLVWLGIDPKPTTWAHLAWYAIPLGVTLTEAHFWPRRDRTKTEVFIWFLVLSLDVWATFAGFREWGAGRALGGGITLPNGGFGLSLLAAIAGFVLAIGPEQRARSLLSRLWLLGKTMYRRIAVPA
jgi:hypothetical protein